MAAKIRVKEQIPRILTDKEYLKLYLAVLVGWFLTAVGTSLFFGGFPLLPTHVDTFLGLVFGGAAWAVGGVVLLVGVVALAQKVLLETTHEELLDIDRLVEQPTSQTRDDTPMRTETSNEKPMPAGSRPADDTSESQTRAAPGDDDSSESQTRAAPRGDEFEW